MPASTTSIDAYVQQIRPDWRKATTRIMVVARVCAEANKRLGPADKARLIELLPFTQPTFSKLAQIGRDQRLYSVELQKLLPAGYSIIYEITCLKDHELAKALDAGIIKPTLTRAALIHWIEKERIRPFRSTRISTGFDAAIRLLKELTPDETNRLKYMLDQIRLEFGADVILPRDQYAEALAKRQNDIKAHVFKRARQLIQKTYNERKKQGRLWPFVREEYLIEAHRDLQRVKEVFETIGLKDAFSSLMLEAETRFPRPIEPEYPRYALLPGDIKAAPEDVKVLTKLLFDLKDQQTREKRAKIHFKDKFKDFK